VKTNILFKFFVFFFKYLKTLHLYKAAIVVCYTFYGSHVYGQQDTLKTLNIQSFYDQILAYHPVAAQANLLPDEARRILQEARGSFDPKIEIDFSRKYFSEKTYYNYWNSYLKVPVLPLGAELKAGFERNISDLGDLPPLENTSSSGLGYAGITIPIGQGLIIDMRRNTLRQAEIYRNMAEAEKAKLINKLIFAAAKEYWNWYFAYRQFVWIQEGYNLADIRFKALKARALVEDAAPIDTVEALILLQDRQVQLQESIVELQNARIMVSNYLWSPDKNPMMLPENIIPDTFRVATQKIDDQKLRELIDRAENQHPEILKNQFKLKQLTFEERYRREMFKPKLDVSFNYITPYTDKYGETLPMLPLSQNYKMGIDFAFPIFLRKERGKFQQIKIKQQQTNLDLMQNRREITSEVKTAYNEVRNFEQQILVQTATVRNQERLVQAEYQRFDLGESTLFIVNSRENKLIDYRIKLESLKAKYEKALAEIIYAAGSIAL
jgi:outer membrane protein TolC